MNAAAAWNRPAAFYFSPKNKFCVNNLFFRPLQYDSDNHQVKDDLNVT